MYDYYVKSFSQIKYYVKCTNQVVKNLYISDSQVKEESMHLFIDIFCIVLLMISVILTVILIKKRQKLIKNFDKFQEKMREKR